jgi:hypothetical protein
MGGEKQRTAQETAANGVLVNTSKCRRLHILHADVTPPLTGYMGRAKPGFPHFWKTHPFDILTVDIFSLSSHAFLHLYK